MSGIVLQEKLKENFYRRYKLATTKIWKVVKRIDHVIDYAKNKEKTKVLEFNNNNEMIVDDLINVIDYAKNKDKTEKEFYVTGINCEPDSAYEEMIDTKKFYNLVVIL